MCWTKVAASRSLWHPPNFLSQSSSSPKPQDEAVLWNSLMHLKPGPQRETQLPSIPSLTFRYPEKIRTHIKEEEIENWTPHLEPRRTASQTTVCSLVPFNSQRELFINHDLNIGSVSLLKFYSYSPSSSLPSWKRMYKHLDLLALLDSHCLRLPCAMHVH